VKGSWEKEWNVLPLLRGRERKRSQCMKVARPQRHTVNETERSCALVVQLQTEHTNVGRGRQHPGETPRASEAIYRGLEQEENYFVENNGITERCQSKRNYLFGK